MKNMLFDINEVAGKKIVKHHGFVADPCLMCGLYKICLNPKIKPFGEGASNIFIIGEAPGEEEDKTGIPFIGKAGKFLDDSFSEFGVEMDRHCTRSNVLQCRPPDNTFDESKVEYCYERLEAQIKKAKPRLIMCFGLQAAKRMLPDHIVPGLRGKGGLHLIRGDVYPSIKYDCWVSVHYHPAYILRDRDMEDVFMRDMEKALKYLDIDLPEQLIGMGGNIWLGNKVDCIKIIQLFTNNKKITNFDYETNQLNPYTGNPIIHMVSIAQSKDLAYVIPLHPKDPEIWDTFSKFLKSSTPKCNQAFKFEEAWTRVLFRHPVNNWVWDTMLSKHILDERQEKKSLAFQVFENTGEEYKDMVDVKNFASNPLENQVKYSGLDSRFTILIASNHAKELKRRKQIVPVKFYIQSNVSLAELEYNGVKIDMPAYEKYRAKVNKDRDAAIEIIKSSDAVNKFERVKGKKFNPGSSLHLRWVFFDHYGIEPLSETEKGSPQVNDELFEYLANKNDEIGKFAQAVTTYKTLEKMSSTYLESIIKYCDADGFLHPTYNLWIARSFRSSCDSPNLQNIPKRDEQQREFRKIFIPRHDFFLEADYKAMEVVVQAILAHDKVLLDQLYSGFDMHRYWASKLFRKPENKITKEERNNAKGGFMFALLYGSYYKTISTNLGVEENHVKKIEEEFYNTYRGVADWQDEQERFYDRNGYVELATGFRRHAPLSRNQIVNTPIQGTAFHCLLDSLNRILPLIKGFESLPVLQIHDSLTFDVKKREQKELMAIVEECSINKNHWSWTKNAPFKLKWLCGIDWLSMEEM